MGQVTQYVGYIAMSLDGFIADVEGGVAWLDPFNESLGADGEDAGYGAFIAEVDALVMGRKTYEQILGWGWPYGDLPAFILTSQMGYAGEHIKGAGQIDILHPAIEAWEFERVWIVGGGATQRAALDHGMFDRLRVFVMPVLLGGGVPLFTPGASRRLSLTSCQELAGGFCNWTMKSRSNTWQRHSRRKAT